MVNISDCFYYIINLLCSVMKLAVMICKSNGFLENLKIVQCNLQIGQIGRLDGAVPSTIHRHSILFYIYTCKGERVCV